MADYPHKPRVHVVGRKNSGKTTLVAGLTERLTALGYKVGTIKHSGHGHQIDSKGKDTWKHREAGSVFTAMLMPEKMALFAERPNDEELPTLLDAWFSQVDLLVIEGWSAVGEICIEVRADAGAKPVFPPGDERLLAYAADYEIEGTTAIHARDDYEALATLIIEKLGLG